MIRVKQNFMSLYEQLENLCKKRLNCKNGIETYLLKMETYAEEGNTKIPVWENEYRFLKRCQWIDKQIHKDKHQEFCTEDDVGHLDVFIRRFLAQADPLSLVQQNQEPEASSRPTEDHYRSVMDFYHPYIKSKRRRVFFQVIGVIALVAIGLFLLYRILFQP